MPEPIRYDTNMDRNANLLPTSRYASSPVVHYEGKVTYPIYRKPKISFAPNDQHYEITHEVEFRPDIVSYRMYGAPDFWWKIMEMNGMKDILEFRAGRNIILPGSGLKF